ncbi:hypothetical protein AVEN_144157-1 [Araneus ventricosus]|uniref:Uncharacterized protein n=1 Tax=Araneus ventricosus TaxID=182803 RepID=A0A4Y2MAF1_ARAVE|nr:hypothetical protein AVEN_144157-1 [Araneus ventricosus]
MRSVLRLRGFSVHSCTEAQLSATFSMDDVPLLPWPPRSPDLTPCDFFLWGYVKDKIYVPQCQQRITAAVTGINGNMLLNVWTELDYRWDVFNG